MRRFLPLILLIVGAAVLAGVYFFVIKPKKQTTPGEEAGFPLPEVALLDRPIASLTPTADGHWLNLKVEKLLAGSDSMDYELLYQLPDGRTQGAPGTIILKGQEKIERKLLLGSESSGKFRYDEGVKAGTLTLKFRNSGGKLTAKFATDFALLSGTKALASGDGKFTATLDAMPKGFFVVMQTFGVPSNPPTELSAGPYGLFVSTTAVLAGSAQIGGATNIFHWTGSTWVKDSFDSGIFIGTSQ